MASPDAHRRRRLRAVNATVFLPALLGLAPAARADEPRSAREFDAAVGMAYSYGPEYLGSDRSSGGLTPYFATYYGRWRLSTGGAGLVLGFGANEQGSGATRELYRDRGWSMSAGLRYDRGRKRRDSRYLVDLEDVPNTLRAKISVTRDVAGPWSLHSNLSLDLLGRGGGAEVTFEGHRRERLAPLTEWRAVVGTTLGNQTLMRTQFGVHGEDAARTGLPVHLPSAGWKDLHASATIVHGLSRKWIVHASASTGLLLGGAASSPLTHQKYWYGLSVGLGYRWNATWND